MTIYIGNVKRLVTTIYTGNVKRLVTIYFYKHLKFRYSLKNTNTYCFDLCESNFFRPVKTYKSLIQNSFISCTLFTFIYILNFRHSFFKYLKYKLMIIFILLNTRTLANSIELFYLNVW